jgi:hypothetical protein
VRFFVIPHVQTQSNQFCNFDVILLFLMLPRDHLFTTDPILLLRHFFLHVKNDDEYKKKCCVKFYMKYYKRPYNTQLYSDSATILQEHVFTANASELKMKYFYDPIYLLFQMIMYETKWYTCNHFLFLENCHLLVIG